ncbi:MAG: hypothetical protein K2X49_15275 [Acetobacteraceae bacterium]|nr:hypothetical protein [Acetobacteraceae bacterium]
MVVSICRPLGAYRTRRAVATVRFGELLHDFTASRPRAKKLAVRPPTAVDGQPALVAPPDLVMRIEAAVLSAVARDPVVAKALRYRFWRRIAG